MAFFTELKQKIFAICMEILKTPNSQSSVEKEKQLEESTFLAVWGLLCFHTSCKNICSNSVKNAIGNLIGIALDLWIALGSIVIFTMLIFPIKEHGISFHLFVSSSNFFHQCFIVF